VVEVSLFSWCGLVVKVCPVWCRGPGFVECVWSFCVGGFVVPVVVVCVGVFVFVLVVAVGLAVAVVVVVLQVWVVVRCGESVCCRCWAGRVCGASVCCQVVRRVC
jgi:hypothetical protein